MKISLEKLRETYALGETPMINLVEDLIKNPNNYDLSNIRTTQDSETMQDSEIKNIHILQTENVKHLKKVQKILQRDINSCLVKNDLFQVNIKTKYYSLLYSCLSEAQFLQILYTPNGLQYSDIKKIQNEKNLTRKWNLMIDIAIAKVGNLDNNQDLKHKNEKIKAYVDKYIRKPQELRNKIAHGQWINALNSGSTKKNQEMTRYLNELNIVEISIWFEVHQYLCFIIRDLIQSPKKGFHNNYWSNLVSLEEFINKSEKWTIANKLESLNRRKKQR